MDGYRSLGRLALFLGLVGVEVWLARDLGSSGDIKGYTMTRSYTVAPPLRARVRSIQVELGQAVEAGQLIAEVDPTAVEEEIQLQRVEKQRLIAAIHAASSESRHDWASRARDTANDAGRAMADLVDAESSAHTAAAELATVEAKYREQADLVERRLASKSVLDALDIQRAGLQKTVDAAARVLRVLRSNVASAERRGRGSQTPEAGEAAALEEELRAVEVHIGQLEARRLDFSLRAPVAGVIDTLALRPGDLAAPELPVATVMANDVSRVVACIPEARIGSVELGSEVEVTAAAGRRRLTGQVESLTSGIAPLPVRCQPPTGRVLGLGRLAVIVLDSPAESLPGQTQLISFGGKRTRTARPSVPSPAPAPAPAPTPSKRAVLEPARMQVPAGLLARSRFEPSGLVWAPMLDRFLIVSDDTGFEERDEHAPWLFSMSTTGVVDPEPIVVQGIEQLNDLESIAAGDNGAYWVLSSQSFSSKGKRPKSRQQLVRLSASKSGLEVAGVVRLAALLDRAGSKVLKNLGVTDMRTLDIEGLAFKDGALYMGLKAPLDASSRAMIWRVAHPDQLLAGNLGEAGLELWSRVKLSVEADGKTVPGGIADLMFVDDQTLLLTATASGESPEQQSGALYMARSTSTGAELRAEKLRSFAGLKPEGIAVGPRPDALTLVFDRGAESPFWLEMPLERSPLKKTAPASAVPGTANGPL